MEYNGEQYYYVYDSIGNIVVLMTYDVLDKANYSYDAWGKIVDISGDLRNINPMRYKGYYYDQEIGLYYLQSRYYDPEMGRFLNADAFASTGQGALGYNMFAYCGNNPVSRVDAEGDFFHIIAGAVIGGLGSFVSSLVTGATIEDALISAAFGTVSGALSAAFPVVGIFIDAGFAAAESVTLDLKNMNENTTISEVVVNATISAGMSVLFNNIGDDYFSSKSFTDDILDYKVATNSMSPGNHPKVKAAANQKLSLIEKRMINEGKNSAVNFVAETAITHGTKEYMKLYIRKASGCTR